jgi:hypothetical protein
MPTTLNRTCTAVKVDSVRPRIVVAKIIMLKSNRGALLGPELYRPSLKIATRFLCKYRTYPLELRGLPRSLSR